MKKAVFILGTLSRFAKQGDAIAAEDFHLLSNVSDAAHVDAEIVFAVTDLAVAGKPQKVTMKMIREERARVLEEIAQHRPDIVIAFGPIAIKCLFNKGNIVLRESLRQGFDLPDVPGQVFCTHSLEQVAAKPGMEKWLRLDVKAAAEGFTTTKWGNYVILDPGDTTWDICPNCFSGLGPGSTIGFDLETYPGLDPWASNARIRMAIISALPGEATIVQLGPDSRLPDWLRKIVEDPAIVKAGSNIKFDYKWLRRFGVRMCNMHDTSTAEHIIDETNPMKDLKSLTFLYAPWLGDYSKGHRTLVAERGGWEFVADDEQYDYAGADGEASMAAAVAQLQKIRNKKLEQPYRLSMDLYAVLAEIEHNGCKIDMGINGALGQKFEQAMAQLRADITAVLGPINPGSPPQLAKALLDTIPKLDLTKRQLTRVFDPRYDANDDEEISTDRATLEREADKHPIIETILRWRRLSKLHSTYIKGVQEKYKVRRPDGIYLSTTFRTDVVETCRLSSQSPNLQNIPRKPDAGDRHPIPLDLNPKLQYVSRFDGGYFMEADLSQAELRIAAMLSQDPLMLAAVQSGEDIHTTMASMLLDKPRSEITADERQRCKTLNFLILYGGGANTLGKQLNISKNRAKELLHTYFATFKQLDFYIQKIKMQVKRDLYVQTPFGFRRRFKKPPNWNSWDGWRIERQAWNMMVQNTAACCAFVAMIDLQREVERRKLRSKLVLQVHDSIGVDVHPEELDVIAQLAKECLEHPNTERYGVQITVPLVADVEVGRSWGTKTAYQFDGGNS